MFNISQFCRQEAPEDPAELSAQGFTRPKQGDGWAGILPGNFKEESAFNHSQIIGRIQFLLTFKVEVPVCLICSLSYSSQQGTLNPSYVLNL